MTINKIKTHGAILGLEAELNARIVTMKNLVIERKWAHVYSCAYFIQELAEELRKLEPDDNAKEPISNP